MNKYLDEAFKKFTLEEQELIKKMAEEFAEEMGIQKAIKNYWIKKAKESEVVAADNRRLRKELAPLREIVQTLLYSLSTARHESIGSIDSHRSVKYSQREIENIRQALKGGGE